MNIIELANESGLTYYGMGKDRAKFIHHLEAFAALVTAQEREECAKVCEKPGWNAANWCAKAIRERGVT